MSVLTCKSSANFFELTGSPGNRDADFFLFEKVRKKAVDVWELDPADNNTHLIED
jgi:hypothetical protein